MAATQQIRVIVAAGATGTLFSATSGYRTKIIKGLITIGPAASATGAISIYEQDATTTSTVMYIGTPSNVVAIPLDFGPEGMTSSATNSGFSIGYTSSGGTITAWFLGTTE